MSLPGLFQLMDNQPEPILPGLYDPIGLCATCRHARIISNPRGSTFYMCQLSAADPRFPKYPRLPVLHCAGYQPLSSLASTDEPERST